MLSSEEFRAFAKEVVPFLHVTSQVEGEKYGNLLQEKGGTGFPHLVAMDAGGGVVAVLEDGTVAGFRAMMKQGAEFIAFSSKKDRTTAEEVRLLTAEIKFCRVNAADARAREGAIKGLDAAGKKDLDGLILGLEIKAELGKITGPDLALKVAAGKAFAEMWKAGKEPDPDGEQFQPYYILMLDHAEAVKDVALFEKALGKVRAKFGDKPQAARFFQRQDERLAKLKEAAGATDVK